MHTYFQITCVSHSWEKGPLPHVFLADSMERAFSFAYKRMAGRKQQWKIYQVPKQSASGGLQQ